MRSLGVLCAVLLLGSAASAGTAGGAGATGRLSLVLPQPGHVTVAEIRLRLPDVKGKRLRTRVAFALPGPNSLPNDAKAISAVLARRGTGSTLYTILLAAVNPEGPSNAEAAPAPGLPSPIDSGFVQNAASLLYFPIGGAAPAAPPIETLFAPAQASGFETISSPVSYLDPVNGKRYQASAVEAVDVDLGTSAERAAILHQFGVVGSPLDVLGDPRTTHGQYDDAHPLGWKLGASTTKRAARDAWSLLSAAPQDLAGSVQKLVAELGLVIPPPPPPANQLYRFSIGGFEFSFDTPPHGNPPSPTHVVVSVPGATACGLDPVSAVWSVPYAVTAGETSTGTVTANFAQANPFQIYLFLDYLPPGSVATPNGEVTAALGPVPGDATGMRLTVAATGAVSNLSVSLTSSLLPIMRAPVASC